MIEYTKKQRVSLFLMSYILGNIASFIGQYLRCSIIDINIYNIILTPLPMALGIAYLDKILLNKLK